MAAVRRMITASKRASEERLDLEVVIQAAAELADQEGLEQLTMAALAQKMGVRTSSLYNHVDGLPGLRRQLALRGVQELTARLTRTAVRGLRSLVHGFATLELAGGFGLPLEMDESFHYLIQTLINGPEYRSS